MPLERNPEHLSLNDMIQQGYSLLKTLTTMMEQDNDWMHENPNNFACSLTTNLEHWHEYGVHTARELAVYLDGC